MASYAAVKIIDRNRIPIYAMLQLTHVSHQQGVIWRKYGVFLWHIYAPLSFNEF